MKKDKRFETNRIAHELLSLLVMMLTALATMTSCVDEDEYSDNPQGNFEALWKIMDEHYCFFDYKAEEYGLDWNAVYEKYKPRINDDMTQSQLFEVLTDMLAELKDGHVNIYTKFDMGRYWSWQEDYPSNYSDTLISKYLGTDYKIASGIYYRVLDDNIGYMRCPTFNREFGEGNLSNILSYLATCNGLIIDIRDNTGGLLTSAEQLAAHFTNEELLVGYIQHKTGKGHSDFSSMEEQRLKPSSGLRWQKEVVVLTNRSVYSAANEFVKYMKCCPNVVTVGDKTGGGGGLPFSSELPNGWSVRFSACPMYDKDKQSIEFGIDPDYKISLDQMDFLKDEDTLIEFARRLLSS